MAPQRQTHQSSTRTAKHKRNKNPNTPTHTWLREIAKEHELRNTKDPTHRRVTTTDAGYTIPPDNEDDNSYGGTFHDKPKDSVRIIFQNLNGVPAEHWTYKSKEILDRALHLNGDVYGFAEMNLNKAKLSPQDTWISRVREAFPHGTKSIHCCNSTEVFDEARVFGGVGMICGPETACRFHRQDDDPTGLGRWTSIAIKGKHDYTLRIVTAYNPVVGKCTDSVLEQHTRFFRRTHDHTDPRKKFQDDITNALSSWIDNNEHIVLMMDANQDIRTGPLQKALADTGLRELVLNSNKHCGPAPATYARNTRSIPIDGIFTTFSQDVEIPCGYLGFSEGLPGDHRAVWMDLPNLLALGHNPPPLFKRPPSKLNIRDPRMVSKYNAKVKNLFERNGVYDLVDNLTQMVVDAAPMCDIIDKYDELSYLNRKLRKQAEQKLRKLRTGDIEWSVEYQFARDTKRLWKLLLKMHLRVRVSRRQIKRLMARVLNRDAFRISLSETRRRLTQAKADLKAVTKDCTKKREEWMSSLANAVAKKKNTTKAKALKALKFREKQRRDAKRRRALTGKGGDRAKTTKMYYTDVDPDTGAKTRHECTTQDEMGEAGARENETRMTRALNSPMMQSPLYEDFGDLADTPAAQQVLSGDYTPPENANKFAALLLGDMKIPKGAQLTTDDIEWTVPELKTAWKKQNIATSAEPTGLPFAHLIAGTECPEIAMIDALLHNLPMTLGFPPKSWQIITDVAILKKTGVYDVELMRTIMLLDSYYNMNNKRLGRFIMSQLEKFNLIPHDQYGSRKGHRSDNQALNKNLIFDIYRLKRWAAAVLPMDASQCYDRMIHSITALAVRSTGVPEEPVNSSFSTLQKSTHHIATAFGTTTQTHGGQARADKGEQPEAGAGQGSGAAPGKFVALSSKIINQLRKAGLTMLFLFALTGNLTIIAALMFVDDAVPGVSGTTVDDPGEDIVPLAQQTMDLWEGCLAATGGAINCKKSCWYLLDFKYSTQTGKWSYRTIAEMPGEVHVNDLDGKRKVLTRREFDVAQKYLGIMPTPNGDPAAQTSLMTDRVTEFTDRIRGRKATTNDVWITTNTTIMKTLQYPMRAINLTRASWKKVMSPLLKAALPRSGFASTFPRKVLYGPNLFQGMGMKDPWTHMQLTHIEVLWETIFRQDLTGQLLQCEMEDVHLALGTGDAITAHAFDTWKDCVSDCWIKHLWEFCDESGLGIETRIPLPPLHRENDQYIMDTFEQLGYKGEALADLNQARMWLNVITLSDITMAAGTHLNRNILECRKIEIHLHKYNWPRQPHHLSPRIRTAWRTALTEGLLQPYSNHAALLKPLGAWHHNSPELWKWSFNTASRKLYHHEGLLFLEYNPQASRTRSNRFTPSQRHHWQHPQTEQRPLQLRPTGTYELADITEAPDGTITMIDRTSIQRAPVQPTPTTPTSIQQGLDQLPHSHAWTVGTFTAPDQGMHIATKLFTGKAIAVSDGSYKEDQSTSGFVIEGDSNGPRLTGCNKVPGAAHDQSSHRAELAGILGILIIVRILCQIHQVDTGKITIGLDNESALNSSASEWEPHISQPDFDLIVEVRALIKQLPILVSFQWVQGHQDDPRRKMPEIHASADRDSTRYNHGRLDRWAKLNIECDNLCKQYWRQQRDLFIPLRAMPNAPITVSYQGQNFSRFDLNTMYNDAKESDSKEHWRQRHNRIHSTTISPQDWTPLWNDIDWVTQGQAFHALPLGKQRWLTKHASGFCGVGNVLQRRQWQTHNCCPRCNAPNEDTLHILRCSDPRATDKWTQLIQDLHRWLRDNRTHPALSNAIINQLTNWRTQRRTPHRGPLPLVRALDAQAKLGWWNFLLGRVSHSIVDFQTEYLHRTRSQSNGSTWLKKLLPQVWDLSFHMWEHRNAINQDPAPTQQQARQLEGLRHEVRAQYTLGTGTLPQGEHWRLDPANKEAALNAPLEKTKHWLDSVTLARAVWDRTNESSGGNIARQQQSLQEFMAHGRILSTLERLDETRQLATRLDNKND